MVLRYSDIDPCGFPRARGCTRRGYDTVVTLGGRDRRAKHAGKKTIAHETSMTLARVVAEIGALLVCLVIIQWLAATVLQTDSFWPSIVYSVLYLGVRTFSLARRQRSLRG